MGEGYRVVPGELADAAAGVRTVLDQLVELAPDRGWAAQGRGVALVAAGTGPVGHAELADAVVNFCERWEWGVRAALRAGRAMAEGLDATALGYSAGEQLVDRAMSDTVADPAGPPGLRPESGPDRERALTSIGDTWAGVLADVESVVAHPARALLDDLDRLRDRP